MADETPVNPQSGVDLTADEIIVGGDVVGRDKITNVIHNYYRAPSWAEAKHQRNRQVMIQNVRDFWIKGVLENSLYGAVLMRLGLEYKPEAIEQPWNVILRRAEQPDQRLATRTRIIDIFDEANGALLIRGAPGSGKTTTLLELARDLLLRAEQDATAPVPVIFPVSAWAEQRPPLADWLVEELSKRYDVPRKVGKDWIGQDMVLPLLDGLDEVQAEHRDACAQAINAYRAEHGLVPLIVCSRSTDYDALSTRLRLRAAIVLQSLTPEQIDDHLAKLGPEAATVRSWLAADESLREMAATPLLLSIMLVVFQDAHAKEVTALKTLEARRTQLFERYIQRMLERPTGLRLYTPEKIQPSKGNERIRPSYSTRESLHWLTGLAKSMRQHRQSMFYLEWMQPIATQEKIVTGSVASTAGLFVGASLWQFGALSGLIGGLIVWLNNNSLSIELVETIRWSWRKAWKGLVGGIGNLLFSLALALLLVSSVMVAYADGLNAGSGGWLTASAAVLLRVFYVGLATDQIATRRVPNEGMRRTGRSALMVGLPVGLIIGLVGGLIIGFDIALPFGFASGLAGGLHNGGRAYLQHLVLRLLLWRNGSTPPPWEYVRFLDYCAERVLLRKVGGGYIFIHRLLMDYFAELEQ